MKLKDYISLHNLTEAEFAERVEVLASTINRLISKHGEPAVRKPSFELMAKIAAATGGKVLPNDFMDDLPELIAGFDDKPDTAAPTRRAG